MNKLLQTICIFDFSCVFGSSGFCPSCQIFTVLMLDKRTLLNCKALIKLVKDSERTKSKMLLFCIVLVNLCTYFHDIWQISVGQMIKIILET